MAKEETARLKSVVNWLISNRVAKSQKGIAQLMGYNHCVLSQVLNGKAPVAEKFVRALCGVDERINVEWVLNGVGSMLNSHEEARIEEKSKTLSLSAITHLAQKGLSTEGVVMAVYDLLNEKINEIIELRTENEKLRTENEILKSGVYAAGITSNFY